jgi:uncharacterized protein (TIGR04255 family)
MLGWSRVAPAQRRPRSGVRRLVETTLQAPVNEVVLSATFSRQDVLTGPLLSQVLGSWFKNHSRVQTVAAYEMPAEVEGLSGILPGPRLEVVESAPDPRYWLISEDDTEVIQVQPDFIALNWRRRDLAQLGYPGYDTLRPKFVDLISTLGAGIEKLGGSLRLQRGEITYINVIRPNVVWTNHDNTHRLFDMPLPTGPYERAGFAYTRVLERDKQFVGRLHVTLQPQVDWIKEQPLLTLIITARSTDFEATGNAPFLLDFLDLGHDEIGRAFRDLATDEARAIWGLS